MAAVTRSEAALVTPAPVWAPTRLTSPRFIAFLCAQFLGALNDNAFKVTIIMLALATFADEAMQVRYASTATALVPIPFLLFSPLAGSIADRYAKHRVLFWTKAPEILAMLLATLAFALASLPLLLVALFLMSVQAAFFSPAKYGILPEVFDNTNLSLANGVLELTTNLAILLGSVLGVVVYGIAKAELVTAGLIYLAIAAAGTLAAMFVPRAPAGHRETRFAWNVLSAARADYAVVRNSPVLFYSVLGLAYFGFLGSFFLTVIPVFGKNTLGLGETASGLLLAVLSIGVGAGAVAAGRLSRGHVELGLVPLGALGLSVFAFDFARYSHTSSFMLFGIPGRVVIDLILLGLAAGLFSVPLNSLLQQRSPEDMKGRLIAFSNILTFSAVLLSAAFVWLLTTVFGLSIESVIVAVVLITVAGTLFVVHLLPDFLVRLILWLITNTIYRVRVAGAENIPKTGALLVANHVSWVDFLLINAACDRMIRFLMFRPYYEWKPLNWLVRRMHAIPVAAGDPLEKREESLAIARTEIAAGHAVCIFAEGGITRTGNLLKFKRGLEFIAAGADCPIVPVWLDGVWGSIFSFEGQRFFLKRPRHLFAPVTVLFGKPLPSTSHASEVRQRLQELSVEAFERRKTSQRPLSVMFLRSARRHWRRIFASQPDGTRLRFGETLLRALAWRDALFGASRGVREHVGILLPPSVAAMVANLATLFAGKIPINLDATPPGDIAGAMIDGAGITTVLTTRDYLGASGVEAHLRQPRLVHLEDLDVRVPPLRAIGRRLGGLFLPTPVAAALFIDGDCHDVDQIATVLYSYPRETPDVPVGAQLSHHNLLSNLESLRQVLGVGHDDVLLALVPFSNALGFTGTFCLPAVAGIRAACVPGPLTPDELGRFCAAQRVSLLPATPAVLAALTQTVPAEQLRTLRFVAVGGGELSEEVRNAFVAKFGVEPYEGYGCPECAPIVSLNVPDYREGHGLQVGRRAGSIGQPLPGISVRIVDPATGALLPSGADGLLLVKGPNVMRGYLNDPQRTRRVLVEGWYHTGDRARLDEDGFVTVLT
jgi:acyl-[acyl-carrier-protein]-phospholipid O-acyltransferase/long-chain-fatty-acid--[acyl-carrier-protein] ligase